MKQNSSPAIKVANITRRFGEIIAVNGISFQVNKGELFGFLGPNGAGKTTTINMLTGLARPNAGQINISGIDCTHNPRAAQHLIGIVPDESNLYPELTGTENLCFCAALYGIPKKERELRAQELLKAFGLDGAANRKFAVYSKGMKRKLTFAAGIIHRPPILFLDEPTTGIDVASARQIRQIIAELHDKGTTIFLTTHYIEEAERLCERVAFIVGGKIVRTDRTADLLEPIKGKHLITFTISDPAEGLVAEMAAAFPQYKLQRAAPNRLNIESTEPVAIGPLVHFLEERNVKVTEARKQIPSLEDVFVQVTGIQAELMRKEKEKAGGGVNQ